MTFEVGEDIAARARELAANTLAYHLADLPIRQRLVDVFGRIAQTVVEQTDGPQRVLIRRSPLPPSAVSELRAWLNGNVGALRTAIAEERLLDAVSATVLQHTSAHSIRNLSDAEVVRPALAEWVAGHSFAAIYALLNNRNIRVSGNRATVEDAVALCENGFGYEVAMIIAALADLAEPLCRAERPCPTSEAS
jgi:hypothetical protein